MTSDSSHRGPESPPAISRVVWILIAVVSVLVLLLELVELAYDRAPNWRSMLGQAGIVALALAHLVSSPRSRLRNILRYRSKRTTTPPLWRSAFQDST
jgi:hypothetical protein